MKIGANRLVGFDKPTVWTIMTPLAIKTNSINLGQGFPAWSPPQFYIDYLKQSVTNSNHQYVRAFGSLSYTEAIANFHSKTYRKLNPQTQICVVNGGVEGLYSTITALINPGDQSIQFDPSYDCYRPQVQMAGGKTIGIPLKPKYLQSAKKLKQRYNNGYYYSDIDEWQIDFPAFEKALNEKTKLLILNSPHNPTGKVFTEQQLKQICKILKKHPQVIVVQDNVYEGMTFDDMYNKPLPKMVFQDGMFDRTLSIYSAGKIFAATGVRSGWVIGPANIIKYVRSVHQYNTFCHYNVVQNTITKCLQRISRPEDTYMRDYAKKLQNNRDILINQLVDSKFGFDLWIPKGGYFVIADISKAKVNEKYYQDEEGHKLTKDYAFCLQLAYENGVVAIPCSPFYDKSNIQMGQRYVRFAFCKEADMIRDAGKKLK